MQIKVLSKDGTNANQSGVDALRVEPFGMRCLRLRFIKTLRKECFINGNLNNFGVAVENLQNHGGFQRAGLLKNFKMSWIGKRFKTRFKKPFKAKNYAQVSL